MLSKEEFVDYLDNWSDFWDITINDDIDIDIIEVTFKMLRIFLNSHFTEEGTKFILEWLFENNKSTTLTYNGLFDSNEKYVIDDIDKLWNYVKTYLLYV